MGINAVVEMGNLEKVWVISCLSLPSHLRTIIPGNGMGEEKQETAGPCSAKLQVYVPERELYSWESIR